ncbi:hypothetical protein SUGI_0687570 [Cryptomeria japonica]|uniref:uncharacterized protein LOC131056692 n=1 Tax=Cryptomeria japonica TaxID=3369 RepID=UPI002414AED5|nr:uncharacterized protein LOC131056692 [Cryptomeria japonica]GLJ34211.1 hypothetical protein SUGI_0687570 [Cryptomeria japonica]
MPHQVGRYGNQRNRERRGEVKRTKQILRLREEWEVRTQRRVDEDDRLKRSEQEEKRRRMEEIRRRIQSMEEAIRRLDPLSIIENIFSERARLGVVAQEEIKRGAKELIGALDTIKISHSHIKEVPRCVICMTEFTVREDACRLSCHKTHIFHHDCLRQWLEWKKSCPLCKAPVA